MIINFYLKENSSLSLVEEEEIKKFGEKYSKKSDNVTAYYFKATCTRAPADSSEDPSSPQTKHWCCLSSQFLQ